MVANSGDIACRVVGVMQVLNLASGPIGFGHYRTVTGERGGISPGEQMRHAECQRIVCIGSSGAIAVVD